MYLPFLTTAILVGSVTAKTCINQTVPVDISARIGVFDDNLIPRDSIKVVSFIQNLTRRGDNFTETALLGYETISGTYNISTQFCKPDSFDGSNPVVQVLTHGIAFDNIYWDLAFEDFNYSYVDVMTENYNFYTLSFDRLGIGRSSHDSPAEVQLWLEVEAIRALTMMLREGTFPGVDMEFDTIIHVGHSFGSLQSFVLAALYPTISDGLVLTGFSANSSFLDTWLAGCDFQLANRNQPSRLGSFLWGATLEALAAQTPFNDLLAGIEIQASLESFHYGGGYLVTRNNDALQFGFLSYPHFDPYIIPFAESIKQPTTAGELLTLRSMPAMSTFSGPVMVLTGEFDVPFCGGNCLDTGDPEVVAIPDTVKSSLPNVSDEDFLSYIQPDTGHGINLHYNSTGAYNVIGRWLHSKGLVPT